MNKFRMAKAGINVNDAIERLCGDAQAYEQLLAGYLKCDYYSKMLEYLEKKDVEAAFQAAHALKGVAGNLSLTKLYEAVVPVVECLRTKNLEISEYLPAVEAANEKVIAAITDMINN